jgi:hypothetical protein
MVPVAGTVAVATSPDRYRPDLAQSLGNLAGVLAVWTGKRTLMLPGVKR